MPVRERIHWQQVLAATVANLSTLCVGCAMGWTAPVLPVLQRLSEQPEGGFYEGDPLSTEEGAWIGALLPLGALVGSVPAGFLTHRYGRKLPLVAFGALLFISWILLLFHEWVSLLMVGRFISGLASAGVTAIAPLYAEEVAAPGIRGALGTLLDLMLAAGLLVVYGLGIVVPVRWLTASMAVLPLCFCVTFLMMPESPEYLRGRGQFKRARLAELWLQLELAPTELVLLKQKEKEKEKLAQPLCADQLPSEKDVEGAVRTKTPTLRACVIVFTLMAFQQLSGVDAILFYTIDIFQEAGTSISPQLSTVITGAIQFVATAFSSVLVENAGRRPLLIASGLLMTFSHAAFALHQGSPWLHAEAGWIPLVAINLFLIGFAIGLGPLAWLLIAELLPPADKRWAVGVATSINWLTCAVMTGFFEEFVNHFSTTVAYSVLAFVCLAYTIFVVLLVPETSGLTGNEIQNKMLEKGPMVVCASADDETRADDVADGDAVI
ncbi:facilitated trehalose transporter Tret1-like [Schistocerca americana]|uniref:facilitated trehalose transporter Tret1-like n=1 Tax=Schistocerca americana TaxID=7009 RepID=UPI001F4FC5A8|nr:facilitated trehalose transporter Tret1-like [Schistocerca americana]